jgi:hypothetical protein
MPGLKIFELKPEYVDTISDDLIDGVLYISEKYGCAIHLCACGCGKKTVTPINGRGWTLVRNQEKVTLRPSIGNFNGESPYHAHYFITENKIEWL